MNEVESMCSNLVRAKITKEGIYREGHGVGDELERCLRDGDMVNKLIDYKVKEIIRYVYIGGRGESWKYMEGRYGQDS